MRVRVIETQFEGSDERSYGVALSDTENGNRSLFIPCLTEDDALALCNVMAEHIATHAVESVEV